MDKESGTIKKVIFHEEFLVWLQELEDKPKEVLKDLENLMTKDKNEDLEHLDAQSEEFEYLKRDFNEGIEAF